MPTNLTTSRSRRRQREAARWAIWAARELNLRPATLEARLHSTTRPTVQDECAAILRHLLSAGELTLAAKVMAPIEAAMARLATPALSPAVICQAVEADEEEAIARARYQSDPTPQSLRSWRIAYEAQRGLGLPLYLALVQAERGA